MSCELNDYTLPQETLYSTTEAKLAKYNNYNNKDYYHLRHFYLPPQAASSSELEALTSD